MKRSYLVQRLQKPRDYSRLGMADNPFSFGGGKRNGGLSDEAMGMIRTIWSFDYMGAAEYEWGAVPEALQSMAAAELASLVINIPSNDSVEVYVLAPVEDMWEARARIISWATTGEPETRDPLYLVESLTATEPSVRDCLGWLELDNGFMFFIDREMWEKTCTLFGVETA